MAAAAATTFAAASPAFAPAGAATLAAALALALWYFNEAGGPLLLDQYLHIAACVRIFESALTAMRQRLISLVRDPDPSSRTMQAFIFPPDGSVIQDLTSLSTEISRKRNARGDMAGAFKTHDGKPAIANWETLRLDDQFFADYLKALSKKPKVGDAACSLSFGADFLELKCQ